MSDTPERLDPAMLSGLLDGELSVAERAEVESQLLESAEWRAELDDVRAARDAVRALEVRDAPPGFWETMLATVDAVESDVPSAPVVSLDERRRTRLRRLSAAVVAVAAVVAAVVIVPHRSEISPDVTAVIAQHGAQTSGAGDPISTLAPVGPLAGFHR